MKRWPVGLYRVAGQSMLPTYQPGDLLVGWHWYRRLRPGRVVVATVDGLPLVKRVSLIDRAGVTLAGDNSPASTDSRHFGPIEPDQIEAVIILRLGQ